VHQRISAYLDAPAWLPAAGQGAIAVQIRADDPTIKDIVSKLNHEPTSLAVRAERAFLGSLEGGCQVPIGGLVVGAELHGFISDLRGERVLRGSVPLDRDAPEQSGRRLADQLRSKGAAEILAGLERTNHLPAPQPE
jgi:hydroxymethylbilane synthase